MLHEISAGTAYISAEGGSYYQWLRLLIELGNIHVKGEDIQKFASYLIGKRSTNMEMRAFLLCLCTNCLLWFCFKGGHLKVNFRKFYLLPYIRLNVVSCRLVSLLGTSLILWSSSCSKSSCSIWYSSVGFYIIGKESSRVQTTCSKNI